MATYFKDCDRVAQQATADVTAWLTKNKYRVVNVEHNPLMQKADIDLAAYKNGKCLKIEIKGDNYYNSGNYYCETIANTTKNTLGCFLITKSDVVAYYFVQQKELHIIPTKRAQTWLRQVMHRYKPSTAQTTDKDGKHWYRNEGRLIPRRDLQSAVPVQIFHI